MFKYRAFAFLVLVSIVSAGLAPLAIAAPSMLDDYYTVQVSGFPQTYTESGLHSYSHNISSGVVGWYAHVDFAASSPDVEFYQNEQCCMAPQNYLASQSVLEGYRCYITSDAVVDDPSDICNAFAPSSPVEIFSGLASGGQPYYKVGFYSGGIFYLPTFKFVFWGSNSVVVSDVHLIVAGIAPTSTATLTPTPITPTATSTPAFTPGCVNATPTRSPSQTAPPFWLTPVPTATLGVGTPWPTITPNPFDFFDVPPSDTATENFDADLGTWSLNPQSVWFASLGHDDPGSAVVGDYDNGEGAYLVHDGAVYPSHYITGYAYLSASSDSASVVMRARTYGTNTFGVPEWISADASGGLSSISFVRSRDGGSWLQFTLNVGRVGQGYMLSAVDTATFLAPDEFYVDELRIGYYFSGSGVPLCNATALPSVTPVSTVVPFDFSLQQDGGDWYEIDVTIEDNENNPCIGWDGFSISVPSFASFTVPGVKVCFSRYTINSIRLATFDFSWLVVVSLVAMPLLLTIQMFRAARG